MSTVNAEVITLDASIIAKLHNLDRELVFRDEQGNTLGYYSPVSPAQKKMNRYLSPEEAPELYARARQQTSTAELQELLREPDVGTTQEVLRRIANS